MRIRLPLAVLTLVVTAELFGAAGSVELFRLKMPDGQSNVDQASDLYYGSVGGYEGLWIVCDRNSGACANQIFLIEKGALGRAPAGGDMRVSRAFPIRPPAKGWDAFNAAHKAVPADVLGRLRSQLESRPDDGTPLLDLEGIAVGRVQVDAPLDFFVAAEQPDSVVLQLRFDGKEADAGVRLVDCFWYEEKPGEKGGDSNDGLEGIAWAGRPGEFFLEEEGTAPHDPANTLLFFAHPRLMLAKFENGRAHVDPAWTQRAGKSVDEQLKGGRTHTLNALSWFDKTRLMAVDRNGGLLLKIDAQTGRAEKWLNLYDPAFLNLRERLADFPFERRMPYVSIEGLARDAEGCLWMVDDPAMPEGNRQSCIIRVRLPDDSATTRPK